MKNEKKSSARLEKEEEVGSEALSGLKDFRLGAVFPALRYSGRDFLIFLIIISQVISKRVI